jgi:uncharacterized membrane protein YebE (DUF533 family)
MFDAKRLLDAVIGAAAQLAQPSAAKGTARGKPAAPGKASDQLLETAKNVLLQNPALAQAALAGVAGLIFKGKGRGVVSALARIGGLAAIGGIAYKAFRNRQTGKPLLDLSPAATGETRDTFHALEVPKGSAFDARAQSDEDALLYLRAMIAAAAADGIVDAAERRRITQGLGEAGLDTNAARWLEDRLADPPDIEELAAAAETPERAAQVYAAARIAIDPDTVQEREFLRRLAEALTLEPSLVAQIDESAAALRT